MQKIYLLCGLPSSIKSFWIRSKLKSSDLKIVTVSRDLLRLMTTQYNKEDPILIRTYIEACILIAVKRRYSVILDEINETAKKRSLWIKYIKNINDLFGFSIEIELLYFPEGKNGIDKRIQDVMGLAKEEIMQIKQHFEIPERLELSTDIKGYIVTLDKRDEFIFEEIN